MAWTKDDRAELSRALREALGDAMKGMTSATRRTRRRTSSSDDANEAFEDLTDEVEDLTKTIKKLQETSKSAEEEADKYTSLLEKANAALKASTNSFKGLEREVDELTNKSMLEQRDYVHRYSKTVQSLTTELGKQIRRSSLFGASLLSAHSKIEDGSTSYHEMIYDLTQASGGLNQGLLKAAGAWNDSTKAIKEDLSPEAFAALRLSMDDARSSFAEAFGNLEKFGFGSFEDILNKGEMELADMFKTANQTSEANSQLKDTMLRLAAELSSKGFDVGAEIVGPSGEINTEVFDRLKSTEGVGELVNVIKNLGDISRQGETYARQTNNIAALANSSIGKWVFALRSAQREFGPFKGALFALRTQLAETATVAANLHLFKEGVKQAYTELTSFNIANIPKSFANVQLASVKLGMSFEETVKFFSQNRRVMAIYGPEFDRFAGTLGASFRRIGFTFEQSADAFAPLVDSARHAAVNLRETDAMTNFADSMASAFQRMNTMTEITIQEFARLNTELLSSEDIQRTLLGMDRQAAQQRALDLIQNRQHYVQMGLSLEQAQEMVKVQQSQQREAVVSRMRGAARAMMLAGQAGLSQEDQMRVFTLARKGRRSGAEEQELTDLLKRVSTGVEAGIEQGYQQSEGAGDIRAEIVRRLQEELGGLFQILGLAREAAVAERAGANLADAELEQARALAAGSETVGNFGQIVNTVSSILDNSFTKALFGGTAAVAGLSIAAARAAMTLGLMGGGGILGRVAGKILPRGGVGGLIRRVGGRIGLGAAAAAATAGTAAAAAPTVARAAGGLVDDIPASTVARAGGKFLGRSALKKIPILGLLAGGLFAGQRALSGDWTGAGMELTSGLAGTLPGLGTAASVGIDAALMARDVHRAGQASQVDVAPMTPPPSVGQPGQAASGVNTGVGNASQEEEPFNTFEVQDMTAHEYLAKIAMGMTQAVDLLRAISESGNPAALEAVAAQLRQQGMRQVPTANSYITGRQAHQ